MIVHLERLQSQLEQVQAQPVGRQKEAEEAYARGMQMVQEAEQNHFENKALVLSAYRHVSVALRKNKAEPLYYTGMAYILVLSGNIHRAQVYLYQALELDPEHTVALDLQAKLEQMRNPSTAEDDPKQRWLAFEQFPQPQTEAEYDVLYDKVCDFIQNELRHFLQQPVIRELSLNKAVVQSQQDFLLKLKSFDEWVMKKIRVLEEDLETQELESLLEPARQLQRQLKQILNLHKGFSEVHDHIEYCQWQCQKLTQELTDLSQAECIAQLEELYDDCDAIADQLDLLVEKADITCLEEPYTALISQIEALQERVDGHEFI